LQTQTAFELEGTLGLEAVQELKFTFVNEYDDPARTGMGERFLSVATLEREPARRV